MKGQLYEEYITADHEVSLDRIAYDLFNEMYLLCQKSSRYGQKSIKITISDLPTYRWIPNNAEGQIKARVLALIRSEDLLKSFTPGGMYELTWEGPDGRIPILRSSDLLEAGYPVNEEKLGNMLRTLRRAILEGHIPEKTLQAELLWIKGAFPL